MTEARHALVVSPDPGLVQQIRSVLEERGFLVSAASNPSEARALAEFRRPSILAIQVELGDMSGGDLARQLRQGGKEIPTILIRSAGSRASVPIEFAGRVLDRPFPTVALAVLVDAVAPSRTGGTTSSSSLGSADLSLTGGESILGPMGGVGGDSDVVIVVEDAPSLATGAVNALDSDDGAVPLGTQELPAVAVESFDEQHAVVVPVTGHITAHDVSAISMPADPLQPITARNVEPMPAGLSERSPTVDPMQVEALVDIRMQELLQPGGAVQRSVERAVAAALEEALPRLAAEMAKALRGQG
jgi:CheY-like chemotaxis protein